MANACERLTLICDRCHRDVDAVRTPAGSAGYYDVTDASCWHRFARPFEQVVCNLCMWADSAYQAIYGIHEVN